jgi:prepilin-type processing-associated H-X9-DG protein
MRTVSIVCVALLAVFALASVAVGQGSSTSWTQWGGPGQEFRATSSGLATEWPEDGPRKLWSRDLGDGYSAILVEDSRLYTMYRSEDKESVICLDASNGKTIWEQSYDHAPHEGHVTQFGTGPRATPLIDGDRIYTIGVAGKMHALNKKNGTVLWSHDLWTEFAGNKLQHGYSSSPIAYKDTIITLVGGEGQSIVAFNKKDGSVAWKGLDFTNSYSTPKIFDVGGQDQLITFMAEALIGIDPANGELQWEFPHANQYGQNVAMPVMVDGHLFLSSIEAGAKGLKLTRDAGKTKIEEVWSTRKIQFYHVSTVRDGDYVYGSTGSQVSFISAVNVKTGEIAWRERGFAKANVLFADGRLIILDEDGKLALTTASPTGLTVHSQVELMEKVAWTVPTIVGKTMYVRDKVHIMALDLG